MSDDEGDVHVCDICQEIFLGTDELEQHMKEDHADKEVGFLKQQIQGTLEVFLNEKLCTLFLKKVSPQGTLSISKSIA